MNLDTQAVAIVRRDFHDPIPGGPPAFLDWEPLPPPPLPTATANIDTTSAGAEDTSAERFSLSSLTSHAQEVVHNVEEHSDAMTSEPNPALAAALSRPLALVQGRGEGDGGESVKADLSGPLFKPPPMGPFTGGAGVLELSEEDEGAGGAGDGPQVLSRLEVLALWQPARLPLVALFPICAHDDNNFKALVKVTKCVHSWF